MNIGIRRWILFIATNLAVLALLAVVVSVLGLIVS